MRVAYRFKSAQIAPPMLPVVMPFIHSVTRAAAKKPAPAVALAAAK